MRISRYVLPLLLATSALVVVPTVSYAQVAVGVSITIAPPVLPIYLQPPIPAVGYIWTPGYWAYGDAGYYWVPGTWVLPPQVGLLWTPGYWGWNNGVYVFNAGYWGPTVGFYGGIDYGFGYSGFGYWGGRWDHGHFFYNNAVNNFGDARITNFYHQTVVNNYGGAGRVSFNGGAGGVIARPTAEQAAYAHAGHLPPTAAQSAHFEAARGDPGMLASRNHGQPAVAATARPGEFHGAGAVASREAAPRAAGARPNAEAARGPAGRTGVPNAAAHAAARPAAPRPIAHAASRPAPAVHAAASRPAAPRPVAHAAARPAPRPAAHAAAGRPPQRRG